VSRYTKFAVLPVIAFLSACTTYDSQTVDSQAAATETETQVVAEAPADAGAAVASSAAESAGETQEVAEVVQDRVICKRRIITGSRFKKKTCMKWSEWKTMENQAQGLVGDAQRRGTYGNIPVDGS